MPAEESPAVLPLSLPEREDLARLEAVVEKGLQSFVEVGNALCSIRDRRLYRGAHATWEDYCQQRWLIGRTYAHRLISAAQAVTTLPTGNIPPENERQARPLVGLDPDAAAEVLDEARESADAEGRAVTAADIDLAAVARKAGLDPAKLGRPPADPRAKAIAGIARAVRAIREKAGQLDGGEQDELAAWLAAAPEWVGERPVTVEG